MKKQFLFLAISLTALSITSSCEKNDPQPQPLPPVPPSTGITTVNTNAVFHYNFAADNGYIYIGNPATNGYQMFECGMSVGNWHNHVYTVDVEYFIDASVNGTDIYHGIIKFDSDGNLIEVTGNQIGTATIEYVASCVVNKKEILFRPF